MKAKCIIFGCQFETEADRTDILCRAHWRDAPAYLTRTIKKFERSGRNPTLLHKLWQRLQVKCFFNDAGLVMDVSDHNFPDQVLGKMG